MSDVRTRKELLARAIREKRIRTARKLQAQPRGGLMEFVRYFWHVLEPVDEFIEGWPLECLCAHLEAITNGETVWLGGREKKLNRLLANVPPGFMKSLCTDVFWPAWEWGPRELPHLRYIAFSYSPELTQRDNAKFRDLICSEAYRDLWGHVFNVVGDGKIRVTNDKTGFKFASSIGGVGTGERGHRILCFPGNTMVATEDGDRRIDQIVNDRADVRVWSFNEAIGAMELKPIVGWHKNPGRPILKIVTGDGSSVRCTHDHKVYSSLGEVPASFLAPGDGLLSAPRGVCVTSTPVVGAKVEVEVLPDPSAADATNRAGADSILSSECRGNVVVSAGDLSDDVGGQMPCAVFEGSVALAVGNVVGSSPVFEVGQTGVGSISVPVPHFLPIRDRAEECRGNQAVNHSVLCRSIDAQRDPGVSLADRCSHDLFGDEDGVCALHVTDAVSVGDKSCFARHVAGGAFDATQRRDFVDPIRFCYGAPFFRRVVSVDVCHDIPDFTYCITVEGNGNLLCGDGKASYILSNCDDINKIKTSETAESRLATATWVREAMQNRLNDLERDAIVVIMQRVHEEDAAGTILKHLGDEYASLMIPMEYEENRHFSHYTGWNEGRDPREIEGQLAWPARFSRDVLKSFKANSYLWAGQYQQRPVPRGGGMFKDEWWQIHEVQRRDSGALVFMPSFEPLYVLASLDTAFSEKEENDYSALTVWAVYDDPATKHRRIMMVDAWQKRLPELSGEQVERLPGESDAQYRRRAQPKWGLVEWVHYTCQRRRVKRLIVENKNRGPDVVRTIRRLFADAPWGVEAINIQGDKWSRANALVDLFTDGMIYAPAMVSEQGDVQFLQWTDDAIREISVFPRGAHDDLVDSMTLGLKYLRDRGWAVRKEEYRAEEIDRRTQAGAGREAIYPA